MRARVRSNFQAGGQPSFDLLTAHERLALLEDALGVRAELDMQPAQLGDMPLTSADVSHAGRLLGYAPRTPLREGLRLFAAWIRGEGRDWVGKIGAGQARTVK